MIKQSRSLQATKAAQTVKKAEENLDRDLLDALALAPRRKKRGAYFLCS
jgi:hypothetical protein